MLSTTCHYDWLVAQKLAEFPSVESVLLGAECRIKLFAYLHDVSIEIYICRFG
jgi:hypothetical protein